MGRAGGSLSPRIPAVGSMGDPRAHGARPSGAPKRLRPRSGRPALVARLDLQPSGDREAAPVHQAGDEFPNRVRLRQRALPRCRAVDRGGIGKELGRLRYRAASDSAGHDVIHCHSFRRGRHDRKRFGNARGGRGSSAADRAVPERQHQSRGRNQFRRRGHGQVDDGPARLGPSRREAAVEPGDDASAMVAGDADRSSGSHLRSWLRDDTASAGMAWASFSAITAASSWLPTPAGFRDTSRGSR